MMAKHGERRLATSDGAVLTDPLMLERFPHVPLQSWFEPGFWAQRGALTAAVGGRGAAWYVAPGTEEWVLRHYRRGGWMARVSSDRYVWAGEPRVRSFAEWRLLADLARRGLPVPTPVAARYRRTGVTYRCDLITVRIAGTSSLSVALERAPLPERTWQAVGAAVARLHAAGAHHADLNAHNILLGDGDRVSVIDFDRGTLRAPGGLPRVCAARNLSRLHRSLTKISRRLPPDRFSAVDWQSLESGYAAD